MGLAPKGSKSACNKKSNASPKTWNPAKDPIDKAARKALSRGEVAKGKGIKLDGAVVSLATPKTVNKAEQKSVKRARGK
jgi:hypothetical protein